MEVRGQLAVSSFPLLPWDQTQVIRFVIKHFYPLIHLTDPSFYF